MGKDSDNRVHNRGWKVGKLDSWKAGRLEGDLQGNGTQKIYRGKGKAQVIK